MKYQEMLKFVFDERRKIDKVVDEMLRSNSEEGAGIHLDTPTVEIDACGDGKYKTINGKLFG